MKIRLFFALLFLLSCFVGCKTANNADNSFHSFLLDKNNNVLLVGNPIKNDKIKELIIRRISLE